MNPNETRIRQIALKHATKLFEMGTQRVKWSLTRKVFDYFIKPKIPKLILEEITIKEIKDVMWEIKRDIDGLFKDFDILENIKETKLNPELNKKIEQLPGFAKLLELFDD